MNPDDLLSADLSAWSARDKFRCCQYLAGVLPVDGLPGPMSRAALNGLEVAAAIELQRTWPFTVRVDGDDLVCDDIVLTCFGGPHDPQDNGETASGHNTIREPGLCGVSLAMDGRQYSHLSPAEHAALDYAPFPRLPWGTLVEITIAGQVFTPPAGIVDLGPGRQASKPGQPHGCDLSPAAARIFAPAMPPEKLPTQFECRGSIRVIGAARSLPS